MDDTSQVVASHLPAARRPRRKPKLDAFEKLASRIERAIRRATNDKVRSLHVEVCDEQVAIEGRCGTFYCNQLAQHAAMELGEGRKIDNRIAVF